MGVEQLFQEVLVHRALSFLSAMSLAAAALSIAVYILTVCINPRFKGAQMSSLTMYSDSDEDKAAANTRVWRFTRLWLLFALAPSFTAFTAFKAAADLFPREDDIKTIGVYRSVKEFGNSEAFNAALSAFLDFWTVKGLLIERQGDNNQQH